MPRISAAFACVSPRFSMITAIRAAISDLTSISSLCPSPMSSKTFPLLRSTGISVLAPRLIARLVPDRMILLGSSEPLLDEIQILLGCLDALLRLLLKDVKHVDCVGELHGVNGAVGVPVEVFDELEYACSSVAPERLRVLVLPSQLSDEQRMTDDVLHRLRETPQVLPGGTNPE